MGSNPNRTSAGPKSIPTRRRIIVSAFNSNPLMSTSLCLRNAMISSVNTKRLIRLTCYVFYFMLDCIRVYHAL